jgi:hypothetical protein
MPCGDTFSNQLSPSGILGFPRAANSRPENGLGSLWAKHALDESEASLWVITFSPPLLQEIVPHDIVSSFCYRDSFDFFWWPF